MTLSFQTNQRQASTFTCVLSDPLHFFYEARNAQVHDVGNGATEIQGMGFQSGGDSKRWLVLQRDAGIGGFLICITIANITKQQVIQSQLHEKLRTEFLELQDVLFQLSLWVVVPLRDYKEFQQN